MPKQFQSDGDIVLPALKGLVRTSPWLTLIESERVVFNCNATANNKVTLLSGGGSGHEPTHGGFVGEGGLDCAVAGTIFASPSTKQIYAGLKAIESKAGTLIIVKNYTGDVLHFGLAAERFKAQGNNVEVVVIGDDVAVGKTQGGLVGRRGLAGVCLVHKMAGAAAAAGYDLKTVAGVARALNSSTVTMGCSLDHCNVPGRKFETELKADQMEIGMGIHNEAGITTKSPIPTVPEIVKELLPLLIDQNDKDRAFVPFGSSDETILLVNNLGGLSNLELLYICETAVEQLEKSGIKPARVLCGAFITALNGPGFSLTLVNASKASKESGKNILELLDAPIVCSGWNAHFYSRPDRVPGSVATAPAPETTKDTEHSGVAVDASLMTAMIEKGLSEVKEMEPKITEYDRIAGDGDCGETLVNGANAILAAIKEKSIRFDDGVYSIQDVSDIVEDSMGGTSGGLYSIYLHALAKGVKESGAKSVDTAVMAKAAEVALKSLYHYTSARVGDRTLIDALAPFVEKLPSGFGEAAKAAMDGANSTRKLEAKFGRASYVDKEIVANYDNEGGLPDPGAVGLAYLIKGLYEAYSAK